MFMNHEELTMSGVFRLICGLMLLVASLFSQYVQAETCQGNTGQMTLNFQKHQISADAAGQYSDEQYYAGERWGDSLYLRSARDDIVVEKNRLSAVEYPGWADN